MIVAALLFANAAFAPDQLPAQAGARRPAGDVVVVGRPLKREEDALRACVARQCPPDEDVNATINLAQAQFVAGDYVAARHTIRHSLDRNKDRSKQYPVPVSDLWLVDSRLASHLGERTQMRTSSLKSLQALQAGLPAADGRVLAQRIELGDARAKEGDADAALAFYAGVERDAARAGLLPMRGYAMFKTALLYGVLAERVPVYLPGARAAIRRLATTREPELKPFRDALGVLEARLYLGKKRDVSIDALAERYRGLATAEPLLLFSPPVDVDAAQRGAVREGSVTLKLTGAAEFSGQWADVKFSVDPDGRVRSVEVMRRSPGLDDYWLKPVMASIQGRRYTPIFPEQTRSGATRVERYTMTAWKGSLTGSRIATREPSPRIDMLDLTPPSASPPTGRP